MNDDRDAELIARAAAECDVPFDLLTGLLHLEREIPDINAWGAKTMLARRLAEVLDEAAAQGADR